MNKAFLQLIVIRYKEYLREPGIIFWTIFFPVLMAWGLGLAFSGKSEETHAMAMVENTQPNQNLREFIGDAVKQTDKQYNLSFYDVRVSDTNLGDIIYRFIPADSVQAHLLLRKTKVSMIIKEQPGNLIYHFDPLNSDAKLAYLMLEDALNKKHNQAVIQPITSVGLRYIDFLVPGLLALGIMNSFLWGISYALIDMRVKKLMRRMVATPMKKSHFLISYFFARVSLSVIEAAILIGFSTYFFDITISGGWLAFMLIFLAGNVAFTGMGILISSRTGNSRVGTGLINLISLPMTILSGIFFSYQNFPDAAIKVIKLLPLTILADNLRAVFIEGAGVTDVWPGSMALFGLGALLFIIGLKIFKWY